MSVSVWATSVIAASAATWRPLLAVTGPPSRETTRQW